MAKLIFDNAGEKLFETGVKQCALFVQASNGTYPTGVAWNGVTKIDEKPTGAEPTDLYADDILYASLTSAEKYESSIECYQTPPEFDACDGTDSIATGVTIGQQERKPFGLAYITTVGNDTDGQAHGYKLHLVYGLKASPSERSYNTINDNPEAITFSYELKSTPVAVNIDGASYKPTSIVTIDSTTANSKKLENLLDIIYGTTEADPRLPLPAEVASLMAAA